MRWALDPANAPAAEALWKLARRASREPVTEALFVECFGFGYADLQERLSDYLPGAVKQSARIVPGRLPALPRCEVKPATPAQIARLRGEWERLQIPFVRGKHPGDAACPVRHAGGDRWRHVRDVVRRTKTAGILLAATRGRFTFLE